MSFGYSISDFIGICQLSWRVYKACREATAEFQEISSELSTLHTTLHELQDEAQTPHSFLNRCSPQERSGLETILGNTSTSLKQVEDIITRYHSLGRKEKKTWERIKFAAEDLQVLRDKMTFHVTAIGAFMTSLSTGSLARIERVLDELVKDVKAGKKEPTIISVHDTDDAFSWNALEVELRDDGITEGDVQRHKAAIKSYLKILIEDTEYRLVGRSRSPSVREMDIHPSDSISYQGSFQKNEPLKSGIVPPTTAPSQCSFEASVTDPGNQPRVLNNTFPRLLVSQQDAGNSIADMEITNALARTFTGISASSRKTTLRLYTSGSSLGNDKSMAMAGFGVFFGEGDTRLVSTLLLLLIIFDDLFF